MAVGLGVGIGVAVGVGLAVGVGVGKGVGVGVWSPRKGAWTSTVIGEPVLKNPIIAELAAGG